MTVMPKNIPAAPKPDMGQNVVVGRAVEVSPNNESRRSRKKKRRNNS